MKDEIYKKLIEKQIVREISNGIIEYKGIVYYNQLPDLKSSTIPVPSNEKIKLLEDALTVAMKSLATYGSHPLIEKQADNALKAI